jgi:hypothetical protein
MIAIFDQWWIEFGRLTRRQAGRRWGLRVSL